MGFSGRLSQARRRKGERPTSPRCHPTPMSCLRVLPSTAPPPLGSLPSRSYTATPETAPQLCHCPWASRVKAGSAPWFSPYHRGCTLRWSMTPAPSSPGGHGQLPWVRVTVTTLATPKSPTHAQVPPRLQVPGALALVKSPPSALLSPPLSSAGSRDLPSRHRRPVSFPDVHLQFP